MPDPPAIDDAPNQTVNSLGTVSPAQVAGEEVSREQATDKGILANALEAIAQSGTTDQFRGYANAALGETKLSLGLAVGSPELAVLGIAQKALGEAQKYIGEAKLSVESNAVKDIEAGDPTNEPRAT